MHDVAPPPAETTRKSALKAGFTLIEMSIVLVIIGLIAGGVLVGRDLILQAQLRSLMQQIERYKTAAMTFRGKYYALPGDMPNATSFWPADPACGGNGVRPYMATSDGMTCNGNGDGIIYGSYWAEQHLFWQHLSLAGLIQDGPFTGTCAWAGANCSTDAASWGLVNAPTSSFNTGTNVFRIVNPDIEYGPSNQYWPQGGQHVFWLGGLFTTDGSGDSIWFNDGGSNSKRPLTSAQAFALDTKYDDGNPSTGTITNGPSSGCGNTTTQEVCMDGSVTPPVYWNSAHPAPSGGVCGIPAYCDLMFKAGF
jgi:prepilin-type N-terminal cleavage/methylation domain-containing protein